MARPSLKKQMSHEHDEGYIYMTCWTAKSISPSAEIEDKGSDQLTGSL
jgi:hypothetical protein